MRQKAHEPLHVAVRRSRIGARIAAVLHGLALVAALAAPDPWLAGGLLAVVLASAWITAHAWLAPARRDGLRAIERDGAGNWWVETLAGDRLEASLAGPPVVSRPLVAVSFRAEGRRWDVTLFPDSADPDLLRRLRGALRTTC